MDELPQNLIALIEHARVAHQPSAADARRVGTALSAIIPGFAPVALPPPSAQGAALKGTWLGSAGAAKLFGVITVVALAAAIVVTRPYSERGPLATRTSVPERTAKTEPEREPTALPVVEPVVAPTAPQLPEVATTIARSNQRGPIRRDKARASAGANSAELDLIERALGALHGRDPALAERLLREHAARFPNGKLAQERIGLTVIALCQQGRTLEAAPLRTRFMQEAPDSPLAARVANACAKD